MEGLDAKMEGLSVKQQDFVRLNTALLSMLAKPEQMTFFKEITKALMAFTMDGRLPTRPAFIKDKFMRQVKERYARAAVADCVPERLCMMCSVLLECAPKRCGVCRAIVYCSRECQLVCASFKSYMDKVPPHEGEYREAFKSWYKLSSDGTFCAEKLLVDKGLLGGTEKGYWGWHLHSQHLDNQSEGLEEFLDLAFGTDRYFHGFALLEESWPTESESWQNLPPEHIPRYSFPAAEPAPVPSTRFLGNWLEYYDWRGLPYDSLVLLRLDFVLTVYHMIAQTLGATPEGLRGLQGKRFTVHMLGPERELSLLPTFRELALLLPGIDLHILMTGPAIMNLYRRREKRLGKRAAGKAMLLGDASRSETPVLRYRAPEETGGGSVEITLWGKGELWPMGFAEAQGRPDLVLALNAGLATYNTWAQPLRFAHESLLCPFVVTDYMETSLNHARQGFPEQLQAACHILPNPFRRVGQVPDGRQYMPRFYNGFYMIIPPRSKLPPTSRP